MGGGTDGRAVAWRRYRTADNPPGKQTQASQGGAKEPSVNAALTLYRRKTKQELVEMQRQIETDPSNRTPRDGRTIYLYTPKARKKLDDIAWAIRYHLDDQIT